MFASKNERRHGPKLEAIRAVCLPLIENGTLDNGIPYHIINMGVQPVCKIDVTFRSGRPFEKVPAASRTTTSLLKEGAGERSAVDIAENLDFYGGSLRCSAGLDYSSIALFSLNKHLDKLIPLMADVILNPHFSEQEIDDFTVLQSRHLKQELHKSDVVAYRIITEMIFGHEHPYGYNTSPEDYLRISREEILEHYERCFRPGNARIFISGKVEESTLDMLNQHFGQMPVSQSFEKPVLSAIPEPGSRRFEHFPKAEQTSLRMGFAFGNRNHPDYTDLYLANTILGGYFGSRLMKNIREEKGYTYNIYSQIDPYLYHGSFYISSEVGTEYGKKTLNEINKELLRLNSELIGDEELIMVKNYLMGQLHNMIDGAFHLASVVKALILETGSLDFFDRFNERILAMDAHEVREVCRKYFNLDNMHICSVGPASVF